MIITVKIDIDICACVGKVFKRLHLHLTKEDIDDLVSCRAGAVEHLLVKLQLKVAYQTLFNVFLVLTLLFCIRRLQATKRNDLQVTIFVRSMDMNWKRTTTHSCLRNNHPKLVPSHHLDQPLVQVYNHQLETSSMS